MDYLLDRVFQKVASGEQEEQWAMGLGFSSAYEYELANEELTDMRREDEVAWEAAE